MKLHIQNMINLILVLNTFRRGFCIWVILQAAMEAEKFSAVNYSFFMKIFGPKCEEPITVAQRSKA
jgi:hypothetical protein